MTAMYGERSQALDKLFEALSNFHGDISNVERSRQGEFGLYADLGNCWDTVRKALKANGLGLTQPIVPYGQDGTLAVVSHLGHSSGQYITSAIPLTPGLSLQATAGEATYARRIAMAGLLGLAADWDDDGTQAKKNHHQFVSDADRKWTEKARKALSEALENSDEDRVQAIVGMVDEAIKKGIMSTGSKELLVEEFSLNSKEVAGAK